MDIKNIENETGNLTTRQKPKYEIQKNEIKVHIKKHKALEEIYTHIKGIIIANYYYGIIYTPLSSLTHKHNLFILSSQRYVWEVKANHEKKEI